MKFMQNSQFTPPPHRPHPQAALNSSSMSSTTDQPRHLSRQPPPRPSPSNRGYGSMSLGANVGAVSNGTFGTYKRSNSNRSTTDDADSGPHNRDGSTVGGGERERERGSTSHGVRSSRERSILDGGSGGSGGGGSGVSGGKGGNSVAGSRSNPASPTHDGAADFFTTDGLKALGGGVGSERESVHAHTSAQPHIDALINGTVGSGSGGGGGGSSGGRGDGEGRRAWGEGGSGIKTRKSSTSGRPSLGGSTDRREREREREKEREKEREREREKEKERPRESRGSRREPRQPETSPSGPKSNPYDYDSNMHSIANANVNANTKPNGSTHEWLGGHRRSPSTSGVGSGRDSEPLAFTTSQLGLNDTGNGSSTGGSHGNGNGGGSSNGSGFGSRRPGAITGSGIQRRPPSGAGESLLPSHMAPNDHDPEVSSYLTSPSGAGVGAGAAAGAGGDLNAPGTPPLSKGLRERTERTSSRRFAGSPTDSPLDGIEYKNGMTTTPTSSRNHQQRTARSASPLDVYDYDASSSPVGGISGLGMPMAGVGTGTGTGSALAEAREEAIKKSLVFGGEDDVALSTGDGGASMGSTTDTTNTGPTQLPHL